MAPKRNVVEFKEFDRKEVLNQLGISESTLKEGLSQAYVEVGGETKQAGKILEYNFHTLARDFSPPHETNFMSKVYYLTTMANPGGSRIPIFFGAVVKKIIPGLKSSVGSKTSGGDYLSRTSMDVFRRGEEIDRVAEDHIPPRHYFGEEGPRVQLVPRRLVRDFDPFTEAGIRIMEPIHSMNLEEVLTSLEDTKTEVGGLKKISAQDYISLYLNPIVLLTDYLPKFAEELAGVFAGINEGYDRDINARRLGTRPFEILSRGLLDEEFDPSLRKRLERLLASPIQRFISSGRFRTFIQYDGRNTHNLGICLVDEDLIMPGSRLLHLAYYFGNKMVWSQFKDPEVEIKRHLRDYYDKAQSITKSCVSFGKNTELIDEAYLGILLISPLLQFREAGLFVHYTGYTNVKPFFEAAEEQLDHLEKTSNGKLKGVGRKLLSIYHDSGLCEFE